MLLENYFVFEFRLWNSEYFIKVKNIEYLGVLRSIWKRFYTEERIRGRTDNFGQGGGAEGQN